MLASLARFRVALGFPLGALALWLAHPTWRSLLWGSVVAALGEAIRIWAAGHLEKGREVTGSGPYRWVRHPLYVGSSVIGLGLAIASARQLVLWLIVAYLAVMLTAAILTEEAWLRARFSEQYEAYRAGRGAAADRRFSLARARANREHRAVAGLIAAIAVLALKVGRS